MRITNVQVVDHHILLTNFENGSRANFNKKQMVETLSYRRVSETNTWRGVRFEDNELSEWL